MVLWASGLFSFCSATMPKSKGQQRLANRSIVLRLKRDNPNLGASAIARLCLQQNPPVTINEATVRSIWDRYKDADITMSPPATKKGAGRPCVMNARWKRYFFMLLLTPKIVNFKAPPEHRREEPPGQLGAICPRDVGVGEGSIAFPTHRSSH